MVGIRKQHGFSLIEIITALVIVSILAGFAIPSFNESIRSGRRSDAISTLLQIQLLQEKWRSNHTAYTSTLSGTSCNTLTATGLCWPSSNSLQGYYNVSIVSSSPSAYTLKASPKTGTTQEGDRCGTFYLNQDGPDYSSSGAANSDCWKG